MHRIKENDPEDDPEYDDPEDDPEYDPSNDTLLYFAWAASVVGPVLFLLAALHAVLWRWPSSTFGSVVCVKSTHIYYRSIG